MSRSENTISDRTGVSSAQGDYIERLVAEAIHNVRRRYALYYLHKQNKPVILKELVRRVASWENCCQPAEVPIAQYRSVYSSLYQTHLPYLEERGLVKFDRDANEVRCLLDNSKLNFSLAADRRTTVQWYRVYLLLAGVGASVFGGKWAGFPSFDYLSPHVLTAVLVCSYAVMSALHWYDVYRWRCRKEGMPPDFIITFDPASTGGNAETDADKDGIRPVEDACEPT